jgi:hypothetical protein
MTDTKLLEPFKHGNAPSPMSCQQHRLHRRGPQRRSQCPLWVISGHLSSVRVMSALPPIADIRRCRWDVREVPIVDMRGPSAGGRL